MLRGQEVDSAYLQLPGSAWAQLMSSSLVNNHGKSNQTGSKVED